MFNNSADINVINQQAYTYRKANEKASKTASSYVEYWKSLDISEIEILKSIYAFDAIMFDYPLTPLYQL